MDTQTITQQLVLSLSWSTLAKVGAAALTTLFIVAVIKPAFYTIRDILIWKLIDKSILNNKNSQRIKEFAKTETLIEKQFNLTIKPVDKNGFEDMFYLGDSTVEANIAEAYERIKLELDTREASDAAFYDSLSKRVDIMQTYFSNKNLENPVRQLYKKYKDLYSKNPPLIDIDHDITEKKTDSIINNL